MTRPILTILTTASAWVLAISMTGNLYAPDKSEKDGLQQKIAVLKKEAEALARKGHRDAAEEVLRKAKALTPEGKCDKCRPDGKGDKGTPEGKGDKGRPDGKGDKGTPEGKGDKGRPDGKGDKGTPEGKGDKGRPDSKGDKEARPGVKGEKDQPREGTDRKFEEWVQSRRAEIASLNERGEKDAAHKVAQELEKQIAAYRAKAHREGDKPVKGGHEGAKSDLRAWAEQQERQIQELRKAGHNEQAEALLQKLKAALQHHQARAGAEGRKFAEPHPGGAQLEQVKAAIQKLRESGHHEQAARMEKELRARLEHHLANAPGQREGHDQGSEIQRLRAEVQELRQAVQQLHRLLTERGQPK